MTSSLISAARAIIGKNGGAHTVGILQCNPIQSAISWNLISQIFGTERDYIVKCLQWRSVRTREIGRVRLVSLGQWDVSAVDSGGIWMINCVTILDKCVMMEIEACLNQRSTFLA